MKNALIIFIILLVGISVTSCGQDPLKYDFSKIKSQSEIDVLLLKIKKENKDARIDTVNRLNDITVKGMHYNGVPIKNALITDYYTLLKTDTLNFYGKKLLEAIEAEKGLTQREETYNHDIEFEWKTETEDTGFKLSLVNGKHLAALGDKDYAELTIKYKPVYDIPLANIHKEIKTFENQPIYILNIQAYDCVYDIIVNGVLITESSTESGFKLNKYITGAVSSLKIIINSGTNKDGAISSNFSEQSYFSATIVDNSTNEAIKNIERSVLTGSSPIPFKLDFNSPLPYYPKAWTDGVDLRNDKNLKEKIIALYDKLGKAILAKDEKTISDLFYQKNLEIQQSNYETNYETARNVWEAFLEIQNNSYKYTIAKDFEIEFNADGKLIYTYAKDKTDMLIFTGKEYDKLMNYFLYRPKGSNELKIIR